MLLPCHFSTSFALAKADPAYLTSPELWSSPLTTESYFALLLNIRKLTELVEENVPSHFHKLWLWSSQLPICFPHPIGSYMLEWVPCCRQSSKDQALNNLYWERTLFKSTRMLLAWVVDWDKKQLLWMALIKEGYTYIHTVAFMILRDIQEFYRQWVTI